MWLAVAVSIITTALYFSFSFLFCGVEKVITGNKKKYLSSLVTPPPWQTASGHLCACYVSVPVPVSKLTLQNLPSIMYKRGHRLCMYCRREDAIPDIWILRCGSGWMIMALCYFWWIIKSKLFSKQNIFVNTTESGLKAGALSIFNFHCRQQYSLWPAFLRHK